MPITYTLPYTLGIQLHNGCIYTSRRSHLSLWRRIHARLCCRTSMGTHDQNTSITTSQSPTNDRRSKRPEVPTLLQPSVEANTGLTKAAKSVLGQASAASKKVLILTGATAVGKTDLSLRLAEALGGEIVSADSIQIYRDLDIGSDKLPLDKRKGIPHHLIDIRDRHDDYSAGAFHDEARRAIEDIVARGKVPIIAGGTGFYLHWLIHGPARTGKSTPETEKNAQAAIDTAVKRKQTELGRELEPNERWLAGCSVLADLDDFESEARLRLTPNNWYRLRRAIEIVQINKRPMSELGLEAAEELDYDFRCFFLYRPKQELSVRADVRCEEMIANGLLDECATLLRENITAGSHCCSRGIGYRQGLDYLERWVRDPSRVDGEELRQLCASMQSATRTLIRKQEMWFRGYALFRWVDNTDGDTAYDEVLDQFSRPYLEGNNSGEFEKTKEDREAMRRYITKFTVLSKESPRLPEIVARARDLVNRLREDTKVRAVLDIDSTQKTSYE